jgi:hypothetical protein
MYTLILAAALGSAPGLAQEPLGDPPPPPPQRPLLNSAVTAAGLGLVGAGAYNLTQANAAYGDYLAEGDASRAEAIRNDDVRPRQVAGLLELGLGAAALGGGIALWAGTEGLGNMPADAPLGRYALNSAVLGAGAGLSVAAVYNYTQARRVHDWYIAEDDAAKSALYEQQLTRQRAAVAIEGLLSVACLGTGAALWSRGDAVQLHAGPGSLGLQASF